jgi:predicted RNA-binding Zn-ribbon protein involved in translation (DUF1610 family)
MRKCYVWNLPRDVIQEKVNQCSCMCEVLDIFGYNRTSGSMANIMKQIFKEYNIDTSHFNSYRKGNEGKSIAKYGLDEILVENSSYANISMLKKRIVKANLLEYKCAKCGNTGEWNGKPLVLQLDHIDGKHNNHSINNLRFLCPNCHSQTDTYAGKNAKYGIR